MKHIPVLLAAWLLTGPAVTSTRAELIGYEPFSYQSSTVVGADGGAFWDHYNTAPPGHTNRASAWKVAPFLAGSSLFANGQLLTVDSGNTRAYGGPLTADESAGAVNDATTAKVVYYRITMTRAAESPWCGISSFDFGTERLFFGVFPGTANKFSIYDQTTSTPLSTSIVTCNAGQTYTLVAKIDYANDLVKLFVDPNLSASEPVLVNNILTPSTLVAQAAYTGTNWSTGLRLASGPSTSSGLFSGIVTWDNLIVGTSWNSLGDYTVTNRNNIGTGSLRLAMTTAGISGGRVKFDIGDEMYAVVKTISTGGWRLLRFRRNTPGVSEADVPITGLIDLESVNALDFRPSTGQLYAAVSRFDASTGRYTLFLRTLDPATGVLTPVGGAPFVAAALDAVRGMDFNPVTDEIRVRTDSLSNLRINPVTGQVAGIDSAISSAQVLAYDQNDPDSTTTTLYSLGFTGPTAGLFRIGGLNGSPSANGGVFTLINNISGGSIDSVNGFDIADDGTAYASISTGNSLYGVNLTTGVLTLIGAVGNPALDRLVGGIAAAPKNLPRNITLASEITLSTANGVVIDGPETGQGIELSGMSSRIFNVGGTSALALRQITLRRGRPATGNGGTILNNGTLHLERCTLWDSRPATGDGGAIACAGGKLKLNRCTFTENFAKGGGAIYTSSTIVAMNHCTFTSNESLGGNPSLDGGGALLFDASTVTMNGCIAAGNNASTDIGPDVWNAGSTLTASACVIGLGTTSTITETIANGNDVGPAGVPIKPALAPFGTYGGNTRTMPPLFGSAAINRARTTNLTGDQRGFAINGFPDSGAAEYRGTADLALYWLTDWDGDSVPYGMEQAIASRDPLTPEPPLVLAISRNTLGRIELRYGRNPNADPHTRWVMIESADLIDWQKFYTLNGPTGRSSIDGSFTDESAFPAAPTSPFRKITDTRLQNENFYRMDVDLVR
jgi:predicted outer membrane repeat protein